MRKGSQISGNIPGTVHCARTHAWFWEHWWTLSVTVHARQGVLRQLCSRGRRLHLLSTCTLLAQKSTETQKLGWNPCPKMA